LYSSCDLGSNLEKIKEEFPEIDLKSMEKSDKSLWILDYLMEE